MTYRELIYMCLDEIKLISDDSIITEDHVKFLANQYRFFLLYQKKQKEGITSLSTSNEQTICVDLSAVDSIPGVEVCNDIYLRSDQEIPDLMDFSIAKVTGVNLFGTNIAYITRERFKYVGYNKWMRNIIYCCLGTDHHLYFRSSNPQFKYLETARLTGIFEDSDKAGELECDKNGEDNSDCDPLNRDFPLDAELIPTLIELIVKELTAAAWRQKDDTNNASDDLANLMAYINKNTKSPLQKQIEA